MSDQQAAFIIVSKEWFNTPGINEILGKGHASQSTGSAHMIIDTAGVAKDTHGLWLSKLTTDFVKHKHDGSPVTMDFLIPWQFILGWGLTSQGSSRATLGFTLGESTTLVRD